MPTSPRSTRLALLTLATAAVLLGCASSGDSTPASAPAVASPGSGAWVAASRDGSRLILADRAEVWSEAKPVNFKDGRLSVQSKFIKHQGTTCTYHVQFRNVGTTVFKEMAQVAGPAKAAAGMSSLEVTVAPGAAQAYRMEHRECPARWGESQEMDKCAACQPILYFVDRSRAVR